MARLLKIQLSLNSVTYISLVDKEYDVSDCIEDHEDCNLDGTCGADLASSDGETLGHQDYH